MNTKFIFAYKLFFGYNIKIFAETVGLVGCFLASGYLYIALNLQHLSLTQLQVRREGQKLNKKIK